MSKGKQRKVIIHPKAQGFISIRAYAEAMGKEEFLHAIVNAPRIEKWRFVSSLKDKND